MEEKEDKTVLVIEEANSEILKLCNNAVVLGLSKAYCKERVRVLVNDTQKKLKELGASDELILNTANSIYSTFMASWVMITQTLIESAKKDEIGAIAKTLLAMDSEAAKKVTRKGITIDILDKDTLGIGKGSISNLRDFVTGDSIGASQRFVDYTSMVKETLNSINERLADQTMTLTGKDGRQLSVRNLAEIETRYKLISEDMERNNIKINDFVIASAHSNASERCSYWQGKIFIVDLDVSSRPMGQYKGNPNPKIVGYIDGKPYYSLLQACENGFLSYNCQHRLIKYYKGAKPPKYDMATVEEKRNFTTIQRNMENTIRKYKRRQMLSNRGVTVTRKDPFTDEVRTFTEYDYNVTMSRYWQSKYKDFSKSHRLPIYEWRIRITQAERGIES